MTNTNCIIETIYSILRYNKIPDEIIIKIVYMCNGKKLLNNKNDDSTLEFKKLAIVTRSFLKERRSINR